MSWMSYLGPNRARLDQMRQIRDYLRYVFKTFELSKPKYSGNRLRSPRLRSTTGFMSTACVGPVFSALYVSNLNPDNVNTLNNLKKTIFLRKLEKNGGKKRMNNVLRIFNDKTLVINLWLANRVIVQCTASPAFSCTLQHF